MRFSDTIIIDRPANAVWACLMDLEHYPAWYPGLSAISGKLAPEETLRLQLSLNGRQMHPTVRIITFEPGAVLAWRGSLFHASALQALFSITRRFAIQVVDEQHTRFTNQECFSGVIGVIVGFLLQSRLKPRYRLLNQAIKAHCEKPGE